MLDGKGLDERTPLFETPREKEQRLSTALGSGVRDDGLLLWTWIAERTDTRSDLIHTRENFYQAKLPVAL